jgi:hypothetical protein
MAHGLRTRILSVTLHPSVNALHEIGRHPECHLRILSDCGAPSSLSCDSSWLRHARTPCWRPFHKSFRPDFARRVAGLLRSLFWLVLARLVGKLIPRLAQVEQRSFVLGRLESIRQTATFLGVSPVLFGITSQGTAPSISVALNAPHWRHSITTPCTSPSLACINTVPHRPQM